MVSALNTCLWTSQTYCNIPEAGQHQRENSRTCSGMIWSKPNEVFLNKCRERYITVFYGQSFLKIDTFRIHFLQTNTMFFLYAKEYISCHSILLKNTCNFWRLLSAFAFSLPGSRPESLSTTLFFSVIQNLSVFVLSDACLMERNKANQGFIGMITTGTAFSLCQSQIQIQWTCTSVVWMRLTQRCVN